MLTIERDSPVARPEVGAVPSSVEAGWELLGLELLRAHRVAYDSLELGDIEWLCRGFRAFLTSEGKIPLERCLRLPTSERALRRARRDHWLRRAWALTNAQLSPWQRSEQLAREVRRFGGNKWSCWRILEAAPSGASPIDEALFEAFRSHERVPSTAMQLHNISAQRLER